MAYMRKNINFVLLFIIMIIIGSFVALTTYYQTTYKNLTISYGEKVDDLQTISRNLLSNQQRLNETYSQLQVKQQDVSKFDALYSNLTNENKRLGTELSSTKSDLTKTKSDLGSAQDKLYSTETKLASTQQELNDAKLKIISLQADVSYYKSQISSLQSQINSLKQQLGQS